MKYLFDSNAVVALVEGRRPMLDRIRYQSRSNCFLSVIVIHELYFGAYHGRQTNKNIAIIEDLRFEVLDYDAGDARCLRGHRRTHQQ